MPVKILDSKRLKERQPAELKNQEPIALSINVTKNPVGWKLIKLGDIAKYINGKAFKPSEWSNKGLPIIRIQNLNRAKSEFNYCNFEVDQKYTVNNGDLLFAWSGTPDTSFGAHIWKGPKAVLNQHIFRIEIDRKLIDKQYYLFALNHKVKEFVNKAHGTAGLAHITKKKFEESEIYLPPISEQHAIVSKIEELFSELDKGKQQLETAQQQLKIYRQAVLKWAFEGKLTNKEVINGELPKRWKQTTLGDVCENVEYGSATKSKKIGKTPVLRMGNIQNGKFEWDDLVYTDDKEEIEKYLLKKNDVLFNRTNSAEWVGKTAIYKGERPAIFAGYLIRINRKEDLIDAQFLTYYLNSLEAKMYGDTVRSFGVNQSNINGTKLKTYPIRLPLFKEQELIVQEIESRLSVCDKIEETIVTSLHQSETLRQSILKKAFEGKLVNQIEAENTTSLTNSIEEVALNIAANPKTEYKKKAKQIHVVFPKTITGISTTDLHAGVLSMVIDAHEKNPEHHMKLSHVKGEKIAHMVEAFIGIELGRVPKKDAAGPDDYPHLKKVEHRAEMVNWFGTKKLDVGYMYFSKPGMSNSILKIKKALADEDFKKIEGLISTFLPFNLEQAELRTTLYAGWNNLLLEGKSPSDEEIVFESRENWSKRKLTIPREDFFTTLAWMKRNNLIPLGNGKKVLGKKFS